MHALGTPWGRERGQPDIRAYLWLLALLAGIAVVISIGRGGVMNDRSRSGPASTSDESAAAGGTLSATSIGSRVLLGVWQPPGPLDLAPLDTFERDIGKRVAIVHFYWGWPGAAPLDLRLLERVAARGSVPMITWEPWDWKSPAGVNQPQFSLAAIAAGQHDAYVRSWAKQLAGYRRPVLLRWAHEMNGDWHPWGTGVNGNTPEQYIAAWLRLRGIFAAEGATNVQWIWSPNIDAADPALFFPGDAYVDWLGLDGYNNMKWGTWRSFHDVFAASYARVTALSAKPLMIAETASGEEGGDKAAWITDALGEQIPEQFPRVRAVVWFNEPWTPDAADYRVQSSARARRAFAEAVAAPMYLSRWE